MHADFEILVKFDVECLNGLLKLFEIMYFEIYVSNLKY